MHFPPAPYGHRAGGFHMSRHISIRGGGCCPPRPCPPPIQINNFGGFCPPRPCPPAVMPMPYPVAMPTPMPIVQQPQTVIQPMIINQSQPVAASQSSVVNEFNPFIGLPPMPPAAPPKKKNWIKTALIGLAIFLGIKHLNKQKEETEVTEEQEPDVVIETDDLPDVPGDDGSQTGG